MPKLIKADGTTKKISPANGSSFQLKELYGLLECRTIELVDLSGGKMMIIDEEGKLSQKKPNRTATDIAHKNNSIFSSDFIAGHAILCKHNHLK